MLKLIFLFLPLVSSGASPILRPSPADFSQISSFTAEWCATHVETGVSRICYGKTFYRHSVSIRSLLIFRPGSEDLYVEESWPAVELLKPRFRLVGPVHSSPSRPELGEVSLQFDQDGEVESFRLWLPSLGSIQVRRP